MSKNKTLHPQWERFLKELSDNLSKPSPDIPSVRCLTKKTLVSLFSNIQKTLALPSTFPNGTEILRLLSSMGLASTIATIKCEKKTPSKEFYLVGISASHDTMADPIEILQSYKPDGVICFFSALSYYELTTQFPTHHHIATIVKPILATKTEQTRTNISSSTRSNRTAKLGSLAFSYQGIPFYTTKRSRNTIPGIKNRRFNPRANIKITSKEQTLLDTLHYPLHCGGPGVIFEAWDTQLDSLDEKSLFDLLETINSPPLTRRLGALFDFLNYKPKTELSQLLRKTREKTQQLTELTEISLLRGFHYSHINPNWKVFTP